MFSEEATKSPTSITREERAGIGRPMSPSGLRAPTLVTKSISTVAKSGNGLNTTSCSRDPGVVDPDANTHSVDPSSVHAERATPVAPVEILSTRTPPPSISTAIEMISASLRSASRRLVLVCPGSSSVSSSTTASLAGTLEPENTETVAVRTPGTVFDNSTSETARPSPSVAAAQNQVEERASVGRTDAAGSRSSWVMISGSLRC